MILFSFIGKFGSLVYRYHRYMFSNVNVCDVCRWITYEEADGLAEDFGRGLKLLNSDHEMPICMFADTRYKYPTHLLYRSTYT